MLGVSSLSVLGIVTAGWASNSHYPLIGALRSSAQMVSYEVAMGLAVVSVILMTSLNEASTGTLSMIGIVEAQFQQRQWFAFTYFPLGLIAFVVFAISMVAETNRAPFDLAEAESELTAGFHTEYSGMKFALFFLAEYVNIFIVCAIGATLFFGGWMPFHIGNWQAFNHVMDYIPSSLWFFGKTFFLIFLIMWFRWTFPRLRIDQLLNLEWKYLLPISMFNLMLMALIAIMGWHF
jgi:NADH-quinone oxidoreductase subunit H